MFNTEVEKGEEEMKEKEREEQYCLKVDIHSSSTTWLFQTFLH